MRPGQSGVRHGVKSTSFSVEMVAWLFLNLRQQEGWNPMEHFSVQQSKVYPRNSGEGGKMEEKTNYRQTYTNYTRASPPDASITVYLPDDSSYIHSPQPTLVFFADQGSDVVLEAVAIATGGKGSVLHWVQLGLELEQAHLQRTEWECFPWISSFARCSHRSKNVLEKQCTM